MSYIYDMYSVVIMYITCFYCLLYYYILYTLYCTDRSSMRFTYFASHLYPPAPLEITQSLSRWVYIVYISIAYVYVIY